LPFKKTIVHLLPDPVQLNSGLDHIIQGLCTARSYHDAVERTILIGPLLSNETDVLSQLGTSFRILHSSRAGVMNHSCSNALSAVESNFNVSILYGMRSFNHPQTNLPTPVELILLDVSRANLHPVNVLKSWIYEEFDLPSDQYERNPQYDLYVKLAPASLAALRALGVSDPSRPAVLISHDYPGVPTALAGMMDPLGAFKTVFWAHEVPTIHRLVESYPGHDTMFSNALLWARRNHYYLTEMFGSQDFFYFHALTTVARHCDHIITTGKHIRQELRFLNPHFDAQDIDLVFSALPYSDVTWDQKNDSHTRLQQYVGNLQGYCPDYIFTHVAPVTVCQAHWRDINILDHLEAHFAQTGKTGAYIIFSTDAHRQDWLNSNCDNSADHARSRRVAHRGQHWALSPAEADLYHYIQDFNSRSTHIKALLVNPLGWQAHKIDSCIPEGMSFSDLHLGTDLEFAQGIYDPCNASTLAVLASGGLCVLSGVNGTCDLIDNFASTPPENVIIADYTQIGSEQAQRETILNIDQSTRDQLEADISAQVAQTIMQRLPASHEQRTNLLEHSTQLADQLNWDELCSSYFLPTLERAYYKRRDQLIA